MRRFAAERREKRGLGKPATFNFRRGRFLVKRPSRRDRIRAKLREFKEELRRRRHEPTDGQGQWLQQVVTGWFDYHAMPTHSARRAGRPLAPPSPHPPSVALPTLRRLTHPRWEPGAGMLHAGLCAGA
jgi:hypothetical protein